MAKTDDGGPAFPRPASEDRASGDQPDGNRTVIEQPGMSLRDYFAAAAMTGWLTGLEINQELPDPDYVAENCYRYADAMLKARG